MWEHYGSYNRTSRKKFNSIETLSSSNRAQNDKSIGLRLSETLYGLLKNSKVMTIFARFCIDELIPLIK